MSRQHGTRNLRSAVAGMLALGFSLGAVAGAASAQGYPSKSIRIVDGFPPGGGTDFLSRTIGQKLTEARGQPVVGDNRPGASSNIGAEIAAKATPDGYTLFMGLTSVLAPSMTMYPKLPYNLLRDLAPVTRVATGAYLLIATAGMPAKTVQEVIAIAKAKPGQMNYASSGVGSPAHLAGELFNLRAGTQIVHIAYKGGAPAAAAIATGDAQLSFVSVPAGMPLIKAGKARVIGVTTAQRSKGLPDLPTLAESGLPGYDVTVTYGLFVPAGTPAAIIGKLNGEVTRILGLADIAERMSAFGLEAGPSSPADFARVVREEVDLWAKVVKQAKITIN